MQGGNKESITPSTGIVFSLGIESPRYFLEIILRDILICSFAEKANRLRHCLKALHSHIHRNKEMS